jgi:hypothetical protein
MGPDRAARRADRELLRGRRRRFLRAGRCLCCRGQTAQPAQRPQGDAKPDSKRFRACAAAEDPAVVTGTDAGFDSPPAGRLPFAPAPIC